MVAVPDDIHADRILIIDFGSQYTQLIARRIREIGVYCEVYSFDGDPQKITAFSPKGIILSGGPASVTVTAGPRAPDLIFDLQVPILGICYGMQTMAVQRGGRVESRAEREFGYAKLMLDRPSALLTDLPTDLSTTDVNENELATAPATHFDVWMSHGDQVVQLPDGFEIIAHTDTAPIAAMSDEVNRWYGLQFHPEVTHTPLGKAILQRFVVTVCQCRTVWTADHIMADRIHAIRTQVGQEGVVLALSGGVDSTVTAALLHQAIGTQLTGIFVDTGLMRESEGDQVIQVLTEQLGVRIVRVNAEERFFAALTGIADPEIKRKRIGQLFITVFAEQAKLLANVQWLAQGTIYPDVIESAGTTTGNAEVIKSHHNVGGLPEEMPLKLLEPLRELFKDEVRRLGVALGLAPALIYRHPFPGPGLAVRILGEISHEAIRAVRRADAIFIEELRRFNLYDQVSQAFAVYLPVRSVAVMGDSRRYDPVIALRAVETVDFMTARWSQLPYELLDTVARRITNEVAGISRVVYDISGKPPATIEWE